MKFNVAIDLLQVSYVDLIIKSRGIKMEKRPLYASVFICAFCFFYSMTHGTINPLDWGYFIVGFLLTSNYLIKK